VDKSINICFDDKLVSDETKSLRISADTVLSYQKLQNKEVNLQKLCTSEVMDQKIIQTYISTLQKEYFQKRNLINSEEVIRI
jgi:hypothetical protein